MFETLIRHYYEKFTDCRPALELNRRSVVTDYPSLQKEENVMTYSSAVQIKC
jgi:hypothetical protein